MFSGACGNVRTHPCGMSLSYKNFMLQHKLDTCLFYLIEDLAKIYTSQYFSGINIGQNIYLMKVFCNNCVSRYVNHIILSVDRI